MVVVWLILAILPLTHAESPVSVFPLRPITNEGRNITFTCLLVTARQDSFRSIQWLLNGSELSTLGVDNPFDNFEALGSGVGTLTFIRVPLQYNDTIIQCRGQLASSRNPTSNGVTLLLQGALSAVGSLEITTTSPNSINTTSVVSLNWTAPFTLDVFATAIDITYCVDVISHASSLLLHSECWDTDVTGFEYQVSPTDVCEDIVFVVIPRNRVGNGTSNSIHYSHSFMPPELATGQEIALSGTSDEENGVIITIALVCHAELTLRDENTGDTVKLSVEDAVIPQTSFQFSSQNLTVNRRFTATVNASNLNGSAISTFSLSTYDVAAISIATSPLQLSTTYLPGSASSGVLCSLLFLSSHGVIDFSRSVHLTLTRTDSLSYRLPFDLPSSGIYYFYGYNVEPDGFLPSGEVLPAVAHTFLEEADNGNSQNVLQGQNSEIESCDVMLTGLVISATCAFSSSSLATGFLMMVQRRSVDKARRLLVNRTLDGQIQGPVMVAVGELGASYQVTIFLTKSTGILGFSPNTVPYTTGISTARLQQSTNLVSERPNSTSPPPPSDSPTATSLANNTETVIIGVGAGLGVLALLVLILGGAILILQYRRAKLLRNRDKITGEAVSAHVEFSKGDDVFGLPARSSLLYEEIGDVKNSFSYTNNALYNLTTSGATSAATAEVVPGPNKTSSHDYEMVKAGGHHSPYKVKQCSAYGVLLKASEERSCDQSCGKSCEPPLPLDDKVKEVSTPSLTTSSEVPP